jgi:hypothetical protein
MKYLNLILILLLLNYSLCHKNCFAGSLSPEGIIDDTIKDIARIIDNYEKNEQTFSGKIKLYNDLLNETIIEGNKYRKGGRNHLNYKEEETLLLNKLIDTHKYLLRTQKEVLEEIELKIEDLSFYFLQFYIDKIYSSELDEEVERYINAVIYYWKKGDEKRMNLYIVRLAETSSSQLQINSNSAYWNILTAIPLDTKYRCMPFWIYYLKMKKNGIDMDPITFFKGKQFSVKRRIRNNNENQLSLKKIVLFPKDLLCYILTLPQKL